MNDLTRMLVLGFLNGLTFGIYMLLIIPERDQIGRFFRIVALTLATAAMTRLLWEALGAS